MAVVTALQPLPASARRTRRHRALLLAVGQREQFPAAAGNAVILLGITILIISSLTRIVDIRKEL